MIEFENGPKSPTTRVVLHTLAVHMGKSGGFCFPSTKILSIESGLSERVVCHHIRVAAGAGWIKKEAAGHTGQGWKRNKYQAAIPTALTESKCVYIKGADAGSAPYYKGTDFECKKALT